MLNAFRHQRENHGTRVREKCSATCAQRLSASEGKSLANLGPGTTRVPCAQRLSASEGKSRQPVAVGHPPFQSVLNAFRHQRENHHHDALPGVRPAGRAQRLSASEGKSQAYDHRLPDHPRREVLNAFRHQRENHSSVSVSPRRPSDVLNAFRHQRENHGDGSSSARWRGGVLNAFRHQRENHAQRGAITTRGELTCSTPFGIRGKITESSLAVNRST